MVASDIASRLAELRARLGESQEVFGQRFGREWKQVSQWENGRQAPRRKTLERAATVNGWPLEIFVEGGPRPSEIPLLALQCLPAPQSSAEGVSAAARAERLAARLAFLRDSMKAYKDLGQTPGPGVLEEWLRVAAADLDPGGEG